MCTGQEIEITLVMFLEYNCTVLPIFTNSTLGEHLCWTIPTLGNHSKTKYLEDICTTKKNYRFSKECDD